MYWALLGVKIQAIFFNLGGNQKLVFVTINLVYYKFFSKKQKK